MKRPDAIDYVEPEEKPDGNIVGYLNKYEYIEALEDYCDYLEVKANRVLGGVVNSFYCQTEHEKGGARCDECCNDEGSCFFKK